MKQVRRLKLEEVKVLAQEGIELNAAEYQRQVEEREAQRRQEREERLAKEAMLTLEAMEREEQQAAARGAEHPELQGELVPSYSSSTRAEALTRSSCSLRVLRFCFLSFPGLEAKLQSLTEDTAKKKPKRSKKMLSIHSAITGFEEAFEQFATASAKNMVVDQEAELPLQGDLLDVSDAPAGVDWMKLYCSACIEG